MKVVEVYQPKPWTRDDPGGRLCEFDPDTVEIRFKLENGDEIRVRSCEQGGIHVSSDWNGLVIEPQAINVIHINTKER